MGFIKKFFGGEQSSNDKREDFFARMMTSDMGKAPVKAKILSNGHPKCSNCGYEFPWTEEHIRENSGGVPLLMCPKYETPNLL